MVVFQRAVHGRVVGSMVSDLVECATAEQIAGGHWIESMGWDQNSDGSWKIWIFDGQDGNDLDGYPDEIRLWSITASAWLGDEETSSTTDTESESESDTEPQDTWDSGTR